ncbi:hypothetical protein [Kaistia terrae]|uniref:Uncharacterized protein n=1 Tax=Kaistia terrae TaxID=537017 RepID=A0ABW0Q143_9HYPH|nr:hypothetical protein [Kaistia terrae]MCX5578985.1 hypothetical protein [Kaistia terrae]
MALTALQRKQKQLERQREQERLQPDSTYPFLQEPFFEWLKRTEGYGDWDSGVFHLHASQVTIPDFDDDSGPHSVDGETELHWKDNPEESHYAGFERSIGRAECLVDDLLSAASNFALVINSYKREKLKAKIVEIEQADLSDSAAKKKALADIVRLQKLLDQLDKRVRWTFPQWKVKGV